MKTTGIAYSVEDSDSRIREILEAGDQTFEELNSIPSSDRLTYTNGFYVNCTAVFIDIRGSSELPNIHNRPVLAKLYRAYLSECVSILNQNPNCKEVFITGDCVSGIFDTPRQLDIDDAVYCAGELNAFLSLLNFRLRQRNYTEIQCGIGIDYGRALMIKAGSKGSAINEIVWMGDVVNGASNLCHQGGKDGRQPIQLAKVIKENITRADYLALLSPVGGGLFSEPTGYEGNFVATAMSNWIGDLMSRNSQGLDLAALIASLQRARRDGPEGTTLLHKYGPPNDTRW